MYTRCPSCSSTFRVTAAILQMAAGEVRCGACGGVFNALDTLVDDWTGSDLLLPGAPRLTHPDNSPSAPEPEPMPADGGTAEDALEFNVPENEWQRFFLSPPENPSLVNPRPEPALGDTFQEPVDDAEQVAATVDDAETEGDDREPWPDTGGLLDRETADTDTWKGFLNEVEPEVPAIPEADLAEEAEDDAEPLFVLGDEANHAESTLVMLHRPGEADAGPKDEPATVAEDPADVWAGQVEAEIEPADDAAGAGQVAGVMAAAAAPETVLDWGPPPSFGTRQPARRSHAGRWFAASLVAALLLAAQLLHQFRDELAASPAYGAAVRGVYARLGLPLDPDWPLDAYEIRSRKAQVRKSAQGTLDIAAEIAVTSSYPVGLPVLRVVLLDRWSNIIASGEFGPAEYLAETPPSSSVYPPGALIPVAISLEDPGDNATGWDLDVCMPNRHAGLRCKKARDPFQR